MPKSSKAASTKKKSASPERWYKRAVTNTRSSIDDFLARRPHRSFRRTRRRDYVRTLALPGYVSFTNEVHQTVWKLKEYFLPLLAVYIILYGILLGIGSQETYSALNDALQSAGNEVLGGDWGALNQAGLLFASVATSGISEALTEAQQIFAVLLTVMIWLTVVWLLRNRLAGHKVKLRDAVYSSGSPLFATIVVALVIAIQLLPAALAAIGLSAASASGLLDSGVEAMLFWLGAGLLSILSLYWITSSLFALVIITLPGMYPFRALKASGDIVLGRRIQLLLRWLWMILTVVVAWAVILIPIILIDMWLKSIWPQIEWVPIVPFALLVMGSLTIVWTSVYIYLLYRKVVDNATE